MRVDFKISGIDNVLDTLRSLPPEIVSKRGGPVKLALAKGARVIKDQAQSNLSAAIAQGGNESTGLLERNLVVTRGKEPSGSKGERYLVRVKRKQYEDKKKQATTLKTANLLEYGSEHQSATPWLRPAFAATSQKAINVITDDLVSRINRIVKKLSRQKKPTML